MRRQKHSNKSFIIGFVVTVLVLSGVTLGLLFTKPSVQVVDLPKSVPAYSATWGRYVPSTAMLFGFENYTLVRQFATYPLFTTLIDIPDLNLSLTGQGMRGILTIALRTPNASVDIAFLNDAAFRNFTTTFSVQQSNAVVGDNPLYYIRNFAQGQFQYAWLAIIPSDRAVAISLGSEVAKQGVMEVLGVQNGTVPSIISRQDVRQMLYVVNGTAGHLSIGLQDFPGVVHDGTSTMTVVDATSSSVHLRRLVEFNDSQTAVNDWTELKSAYLNSHLFTVYGSYVEATEIGLISNLGQYVRLVE